MGSVVAIGIAYFLTGCVSQTPESVPELHIVQIKQMKYEPAELTVNKGDTIVWVNNDIVNHDVTEEANHTWTSGLMPVGQSWRMVANQSSDYYCSIHVVMKGKVIVR
jgi:plastocyanin